MVAWLAAPCLAQTGDDALFARLREYRLGADDGLPAELAQRVSEARPNAARRRAMARELADILGSNATSDAKQLACRELVLLATNEQLPALLPLLHDEQLAHYGLMVLACIPGPAVTDALLRELPGAAGRVRLGIIQALGERRDPRVVGPLASLLTSADRQDASAAAAAIGMVGGKPAALVLKRVYAQTTGQTRLVVARALVACADDSLAANDRQTAIALYALVDASAADPVVRAAALRGTVRAKGAVAVPLILKALTEDATARQRMAASLARQLPGTRVTKLLCAGLPKLSPNGQLLLVAALADRRDPAAATALLSLRRSPVGAVRVAAMRALGPVAGGAAVYPLLVAAASGTAEERAAAKASLAQLRGADVDRRLLDVLRLGEPALQAEAIEALGQRGAVAAGPHLVAALRSRSREVRAAAAHVLQSTAGPAQLPAVLSAMLATHPAERGDLLVTAAQAARRGTTEQQRTAPVLKALAAARRPADRVSLLTLLGQVGGPKALAELRKAAADPNAEIRLCAVRVLAEWPTSQPAADLLRLAKGARSARERAIALRGYVRLVGTDETRSPEQRLAMYRDALSLADSREERLAVLAGLARLRLPGALECAAGLASDQGVREEAEAAEVAIARSIAGAWPDVAKAALQRIASSGLSQQTRQNAADALATIANSVDYVLAWEVSPAYQQPGADCTRLFDISFPPEDPAKAKAVRWTVMPVATNPQQPWLIDLLALHGGEQRVAYLRTAVWSATERDLRLELGSDDGVKAWWNGQVVLAHNVQRAVEPGQERVTVHAKAGWNLLMLKITQNVMGWGACARFALPDGGPVGDLRCAVPSDPEVRRAVGLAEGR